MFPYSYFNMTWRDAMDYCIQHPDNVELFPTQNTLLIYKFIKDKFYGELILMFDEEEKLGSVSTRMTIPMLTLGTIVTSHLRHLAHAGHRDIVLNIDTTGGVVTCTYSKKQWLQHVAARYSVGNVLL